MADEQNKMSEVTPSTTRLGRIADLIDSRIPFKAFMAKHLTEYPSPKNLSYWWTFGSLAGMFFVIQILTGIFLGMHYKPDAVLAFNSVEHIMRDVNWGWLFRYMHATGASAFFFVVYIHIFRGMYYGSYKEPRQTLWVIGVIIYVVLMGTAFSGYLLPWGQMSFWGAQVILNLFTAIPVVGVGLAEWIRGGFVVADPTLNRFFILHVVVLPAVLAGLVILHLSALHKVGSGNPTGLDIDKKKDSIPLHPYYMAKDAWFAFLIMGFYFLLVFYAPNLLIEPANFIKADPLQTPLEIVPEWYLLPFYAVLRAIPDKLTGVIGLGLGLVMLLLLPLLDTYKVRSSTYRPIHRWMIPVFIVNFAVLGYVGANPPEGSFILIGRIATFLYFLHFLSLPIVGQIENWLEEEAIAHHEHDKH